MPVALARATRRPKRTNAVRATLLAALAGIVVAFGYDVWYRDTLKLRERERVRAAVTPYAMSIERAMSRRIGRLNGLKSFVEMQPSAAELSRKFPTFAAALRVAAPGVRSLQLNHKGRIVAVEPAADSALLMGYDLMQDSRPEIGADVLRAQAGALPAITGPVKLLLGGWGHLVRVRVVGVPDDFPDMVTMALDVDALLDEAAGLASSSRLPSLSTALLDRQGHTLRGLPDSLIEPTSVPVRITDGEWTLLAAPSNGWDRAVAGELPPTRIASALIVLLFSWLTYLLFGRQARLEVAVDERTQDLEDANRELRREVSERERVERQLRDNDEQLQIALMSGKMGLWAYDARTEIVQWSEQSLELLGLQGEPREMTGEYFLDLVEPQLRDTVREGIAKALGGERAEAVYSTTSAEGTQRSLFVTATPIAPAVPGDTGTPRVIGVIADITERRQLEERLLHSQKMEAVGTLAGGIAHDFNNLLTAMMGFAQLAEQRTTTLLHDAPLPQPLPLQNGLRDVRSELFEILKAGERASVLTSQLLAFSRRQKVTPTRVDLNAVVIDIERMLQRLIGQRIALTTQLAGNTLPIMADPGQIAQILVNLVVNARDAIKDTGALRVATDSISLTGPGEGALAGVSSGAWALLSVTDDGVGMSPDVQARVFEPFFTTKAMGDGTGLGMSTVYGIVQQAGGRVQVESTVGRGTTVHVILPLLDMLPDEPAPTLPVAEPEGGAMVLVVEDEPGLRRLVGEILTRRGYRVRVAADGVDALALLADPGLAPDLVISDVVMPRMGGRALADEMRIRRFHMPVLFISGYQAGQELPEDEQYGFVQKPFTADALMLRVRQLLEREQAPV